MKIFLMKYPRNISLEMLTINFDARKWNFVKAKTIWKKKSFQRTKISTQNYFHCVCGARQCWYVFLFSTLLRIFIININQASVANTFCLAHRKSTQMAFKSKVFFFQWFFIRFQRINEHVYNGWLKQQRRQWTRRSLNLFTSFLN